MQSLHIFRAFLWLVVIFSGINLTRSAKLRCYKCCVDRYDEAPLDNVTSLLNSSCFKSSRYSHFYVFGYEVTANGTDATTVIKSLLTVPKCNVFLLNWEEEAAGIELNSLTETLSYPVVVLYQVSAVGIAFAKALKSLILGGMDPNLIHLIGHSLGAHLCGYTGKTLVENNITIDRITGLDPAGPLFDKLAIMKPLTKKDAKFVDCIHTDYGVYGINNSLCHTDTYINKSDDNVQPGCPKGNYKPLSTNSTCSHNRCWMIYADCIYHPNRLIANYADNFTQWLACEADDDNSISVGIDVDRTKRGNFIISETNSKPPYGRGAAGTNPTYC